MPCPRGKSWHARATMVTAACILPWTSTGTGGDPGGNMGVKPPGPRAPEFRGLWDRGALVTASNPLNPSLCSH